MTFKGIYFAILSCNILSYKATYYSCCAYLQTYIPWI